MDTGKVVVGVLAGVAAGALIGVLFAPDKGTETRKKISKKGLDSIDELKNKFEDVLCSLFEKFETMKDEAGNLVEKGKNKAEEFKKEAKSSMA